MRQDTDLPPIGWYVGQALENLAELYQRIAEDDRRAVARDRSDPFHLSDRAAAMDLAAQIAIDAASGIRREMFAAGRMKLI
jgi:hypothetical protein